MITEYEKKNELKSAGTSGCSSRSGGTSSSGNHGAVNSSSGSSL